jgi:cytochrome c-type biogenesis protein CcmH/NrfG
VVVITGYLMTAGGTGKEGGQATQNNTADLEKQVTLLKKKLTSNPNDFRSLVMLGDAYLDMNLVHEAFKEFLKAEKLNPDDTHVLSDLGGIYQNMGQYEEALKRYSHAYKVRPDHSSSLLQMALIYGRHMKEYDKSLELLRKFLAGNPEAQLIGTAEQEIVRIEQILLEAKNAEHGSVENK